MRGGSANGLWPSIGELTEVASAKRAVRGLRSVKPTEEAEDVRDVIVIVGGFFFCSASSICWYSFSGSVSSEMGGLDWECSLDIIRLT